MKKIIIICLMLALSFSPITVKAYWQAFSETLGEAIPQEDGFLLVSGIGLTEDAWDEILLYIDEAEVYDLQTGFAVGPADIYEGDTVRVAYKPLDQIAGDFPIAEALEVFIHAGEPGSADFMVVVSDNIWYSDEGCVFVTLDGKYRIVLDEDTLLLDSYGYEMFFEEITAGMEMFVWANFVTASFPGQVIPDKVVLR